MPRKSRDGQHCQVVGYRPLHTAPKRGKSAGPVDLPLKICWFAPLNQKGQISVAPSQPKRPAEVESTGPAMVLQFAKREQRMPQEADKVAEKDEIFDV